MSTARTTVSLLRSTTKPPKPRIRRFEGIWVCETLTIFAKGRTPTEAYREWNKVAAIKGAEVMRALRPFA